MQKNEVNVYTKKGCVYCEALKRWLNNNEVEYNEVNVAPGEPSMIFMANNGLKTVPVLVIDGKIVNHEPYDNIPQYLSFDVSKSKDVIVVKRDGTSVDFNKHKIELAISKANKETFELNNTDIQEVVDLVVNEISKCHEKQETKMISVETIQDIVEEQLMLSGFTKTAKAYILYRKKQADKRKRDIFSPRLNLKPYEYPFAKEFQEAIQHSYWLFTEYNYNSDIQDFKVNVSEKERNAIKNAMLAISQVEVDVKTFWGDLYKHLPKPEFANVGAVFSESETRHSDAYSHLLEILGLNKEFEKLEEYPALMNRIKYLKKHAEYTKTGDQRDYVIAIILFSSFIEHISLFSQFLIIMSFNKYRNLFSGISNAIEATSKEEQLHGEFGIELVNTIKQEKPEWFDEDLEKEMYDMCKLSYESEKEVLDWIFEKGELDFLPKKTIKEFIKNRLNNSLEAIGLERIFDVDQSEVEKTDWFDDEIISSKHVDFFSKRSVNYTKRSKSVTADDLF